MCNQDKQFEDQKNLVFEPFNRQLFYIIKYFKIVYIFFALIYSDLDEKVLFSTMSALNCEYFSG
jgi:hypothetical protein